MYQKSVCVLRNLTRFIAIFVLAIGIGLADARHAYAIPVEVVADAPQTVTWVKTAIEWGKNHIAQAKAYMVQHATLINQIKGLANDLDMFKQKIKQDEGLSANNINATGGFIMSLIDAQNRQTDSKNMADQQREVALQNAELQREANSTALGICPAASDQNRDENGGVVNPNVLASAPRLSGAGPTFAQPRINWGPIAPGRKGPDGKPVPVTRAAATSAFQDQAAVERSLADTNSIGTNGAQGPLQYYADQVDWFLRFFCTDSAYGGAMKGLCPAVQGGNLAKNLNKAGLDTRASDLLSGSENTQHFSCFEQGIIGNTTLGRLSISKCPIDKKWEDLYGKPMSEISPIPVLSLDAAYVVKDYLTPAPLPNFNRNFIESMAKHNANATEIFAKRQSFNAAQSMAVGVFNRAIARRTPQALDAKDLPGWKADYKTVRPSVPDDQIPTSPSAMLMRDVNLEKYRSSEVFKSWGFMKIPELTAKMVEIQAQQLASQKDILYSLERIEMLLATQLSNDLRTQRDTLARQIEQGNSRAGGAPAPAVQANQETLVQ